jgi:acetylornithine/N-succinyldiaminopimelate aminotransferase
MSAANTSALPESHVMPTYARQNLVFEKGEGSWMITTTGERYLDFASGVAVNALGHAHPKLVKALTDQAQKLWHTSNLYRVAGQESLSEKLCKATGMDKVFFCNSGAEACEGAIKTARKYQHASGKPERTDVITFKGAFHGRTLATIAAAGNEKYLEGFGTPAPGFINLAFGDHKALEEAAARPTAAAIMIEPVQGEGGIRPVPLQCLKGLRELCDKLAELRP